MASERVEVEVLDREGNPVALARRRPLPAVLNLLVFVCAMGAALGILFIAVGQLLWERTLGLRPHNKE